ncbi:MAG: DNA polymerase III subunit delta [Pseudobdellovibrionaceae bacterium]
MPQLEPQQLYSRIEKATESQEFQPLYFFFGDEPYLIQQAVQYLKVCALHGGAADFNFSSYYAGDAEMSRVRDEVETLPMMATRRVVILKEVQDLSDKDWEELEPLLTTPVTSTVFLLVGHKVDKRRKFFRLLSEAAEMVEFKKPFENQIPGWIRHIGKAYELTMSDEAVQLIHRLVGNQLSEIEAEIRKLADFVGEKKRVELEDVAQAVSRKREESVFDLTDRLAAGDKVQSLLQLVHLLDQGQSEIGIVSLIARHMRILLLIREGMEQGFAGQKLATFAGVPAYYLNDYVKQAKFWTNKRLEQCLVLLAETDKALKSSPLSTHIWLENLVLKACSLHQTAQSPVERMPT